ncbi:MAG: hypothetical protein WD059_15990 [Balneolaceae bacterium]
MHYEVKKRPNSIFVGVEASFTLIDFLLFFASFLLGFVFALFFLIFAIAVLQKIFSRHEFVFDLDKYEITRYYRFFSYFRFRQRTISFGEVEQILLSNYDSGQALFSRGMKKKEWFTLDINTKNSFLRVVKAEPEEVDEIYQLYLELEEKLDLYFKFKMEFVEIEEKE